MTFPYLRAGSEGGRGRKRPGVKRGRGEGITAWRRGRGNNCAVLGTDRLSEMPFPRTSIYPHTLSVLSLLPLTNMRESDDHAICRGGREGGGESGGEESERKLCSRDQTNMRETDDHAICRGERAEGKVEVRKLI